jgi:hypothetical protein
MTNVIATASGGTASYGVYNYGSSPTMTNVTATALGGASENYGMHNSATGTYTILIDRSTFEGSTNSIYNYNAGFTLKIGASKLVGSANTVGTYNCVASYDGNYAALDGTCQAP